MGSITWSITLNLKKMKKATPSTEFDCPVGALCFSGSEIPCGFFFLLPLLQMCIRDSREAVELAPIMRRKIPGHPKGRSCRIGFRMVYLINIIGVKKAVHSL